MSEPIARSPSLPTTDLSPNLNPWERYTHPFIRDLAFTLACPPVLNTWVDHEPLNPTPTVVMHSAAFWQQQFDNYQSRLDILDKTKAYRDLTRFLMNRPSPYRLGFHFEGLMHFWLTDGFEHNCHPYEVLAHNVQLFRGKQTIGELDYILRNHDTGEVEHWELAIKFFLGSSPYDFVNWVGINSRDNLERKMTHMQSKQFGSVWIDVNSHKRVKVDKRIAVIKGRFFRPYTDTIFERPSWLAPTFPLHEWYDGHDEAQLATLDMTVLRQAHYVEWFTKRGFYDEHRPLIKWSEDSPPESGLYFAGDRPLVIYRDKAKENGQEKSEQAATR